MAQVPTATQGTVIAPSRESAAVNTLVQRTSTYPIPARLNLVLTLAVFASSLALLVLASRLDQWWQILLAGVAFSYVMLTNYALLHEATHHNLHPNPRVNHALGVLAGILFPMPFSLIHTTHQNHHIRNRTDSEMFDLYYPTDSRFRKYVQWYGILTGFFWPMVPIGAVLFSLGTRRVREMIMSSRTITGGYLMSEIRGRVVGAIRIEMLLIVAFFVAAFWLLDLRWQAVLICYACFSFNWSTRQYIGHAYTKRHVTDGAWNLRHNPLMTWILLHGEYDLNHHRRPDVPWFHLPKLTRSEEPRLSYVMQYWRQWRGPVPAREPAPQPLPTENRE